MVDYNGTYKAYPILETDFYSEEDVSEDGETDHIGSKRRDEMNYFSDGKVVKQYQKAIG